MSEFPFSTEKNANTEDEINRGNQRNQEITHKIIHSSPNKSKNAMNNNSTGQDIIDAQHDSLDATDAYASAWSVALAQASAAAAVSGGVIKPHWGGRGKGGRGAARRTFQPRDIVVDAVCLEYVNDASVTGVGGGGSKVLLNDAYLKLLPGRVYALIGRNGVGKSSLMKRISAGKIPGFPPHISSLLVSQEVFGHEELTPVDTVLENHRRIKEQTRNANAYLISQLEEEMDKLDVDSDDYQQNMERICNRIAELEEDEEGDGAGAIVERARDALHFFGVPESTFDTPTLKLSGGMRKKISLACAVMEKPQLLLMDEPTCHIDIGGILKLRQLIAECVTSNTTVVLVSHDVDLMNDVATDVIDFRDGKLGYYIGNYHDYLKYRREKISHQLKQAHAIEKQRTSMMSSIDTMKKKSAHVDSSQASKKIDKAMKSKVKKLERHGVEKNEKGHYRVSQTEGSGMRKGSINAIGASERNTLSHKELIKLAEVAIGPVPDKAVQFDFRDTTSRWGDEPLVMVMDVGHSYDTNTASGSNSKLIFDCVDLSIREGSRTTILGENGAGKSTLLSIIAGEIMPSVGTVHFANGINIGHFHQHAVDHLFADLCGRSTRNGIVTPLSFLTKKFPSKTEHEIRGELTRFGLSPKQAATNVRFLSGGERCRMCMANMMLEAPPLLVLDEISNHLDVESVEALIYGLNKWNGTIVLASHDANLVRSIGGESYVLFDGMLRRIDGGIDTYLKVFAKNYHK